jgi:hypothetical protein
LASCEFFNINPNLFLQIQDKDAKPASGIAIWQASIFIAAQIAGSGVLALPKAASDAGMGIQINLVDDGNY